jgi:RNA polymerase sigma-70 factor (ECF subfamily)
VESETALIRQMLPSSNPSRLERVQAWNDWQEQTGEQALLRFIRLKNYTFEPDEDILQETLTTAFLEVERGRYQPQTGVPFTAYVKGIARNKIREARRKHRRRTSVALDDIAYSLADTPVHQPEIAFDRAQRRSHLYAGLAELPIGRQQVLRRILLGEGTAEIAAALEISEDLVRQHKSRGLRRLRKQVQTAGE